MTSFQISVSPSRRAAGRYVTKVRRAIQKALAEERKASGITQSDIARAIGVHRSVINREIRGQKDITLGRVAEIAWALGRRIVFKLDKPEELHGINHGTAAIPAAQIRQMESITRPIDFPGAQLPLSTITVTAANQNLSPIRVTATGT